MDHATRSRDGVTVPGRVSRLFQVLDPVKRYCQSTLTEQKHGRQDHNPIESAEHSNPEHDTTTNT